MTKDMSATNRLNKRVRMAGSKPLDPNRPMRRRVDGDRVRICIDSTKCGIHEAAGTFAAGFVLREDTDRVPFFFADGIPTRMDVMGMALARFVWHMCRNCEQIAPGFTADVMETCADFAKAAREGRDPMEEER